MISWNKCRKSYICYLCTVYIQLCNKGQFYRVSIRLSLGQRENAGFDPVRDGSGVALYVENVRGKKNTTVLLR